MRRSSFIKSLTLGTTALAIPFQIGYAFDAMVFLRMPVLNTIEGMRKTGCRFIIHTKWLYRDEVLVINGLPTMEESGYREMSPRMTRAYHKWVYNRYYESHLQWIRDNEPKRIGT